ncbi:hypothetical protein MKS88_001377 [Plasmodium brasilianum]|uniref:Uncharacterized protein n=1 Tax=Plasmodium brasilianum TaxID=5824 RepID=A0ACB9YDY0_PLABR|nr:hypothetical protein MKS88_001377 [Plasmodium brasilianum]
MREKSKKNEYYCPHLNSVQVNCTVLRENKKIYSFYNAKKKTFAKVKELTQTRGMSTCYSERIISSYGRNRNCCKLHFLLKLDTLCLSNECKNLLVASAIFEETET